MLSEIPECVRDGTHTSELTHGLSRIRHYDLAKSMLDIALCVAVLPLVLLVMAVIAIAILVDSGRPIFFVQERFGRGRRTFRMYKFRTLLRDRESSLDQEYMRSFVRGQVQQCDGPPRSRIYKPFDKSQITRVGRILRRTSLDELPQIFNVLRGEMSLVGPRPNVLWEVGAYDDWHNERLKVLPGITGLAQVRGRSAICFDDIVRHDIEYVRRRSLKLDLQILWWTVLSTVTGRGTQ